MHSLPVAPLGDGKTRHPRSDPLQPIKAAEIPDALLKMETVIAVTGMSSATIYRRLKAGTFVKPIVFSSRCTRYRAGDVMEWLRSQTDGKL